MRTFTFVVLAVALGASASPLSTDPHSIPRERAPLAVAPLLVEEHPHGTVNNSYIVMLKPNVAPALMANHMNFVQFAHQESQLAGDDLVGGLRHVYDSHVKGYSGAFSEAVIDRIRQLPEVDYVEKDQIVRTQKTNTQTGAPWVCSSRSAHLIFILTSIHFRR